MWEKLKKVDKRYREIEEEIARPEVVINPGQLQKLAKERARLEDVVNMYREYEATSKSLEETESMLDDELDDDMREMVKQEIATLQEKIAEIEENLKVALIPKDENDEKDIIMEIRAGAGGNEAGLFAADLFRMYSRYAQEKGWNIEIININESGIGGFKEVVFEVKGKHVFSRLKYERGVHRVQRVPVTESSGRIHTSTATVAVLPEADEVDVDISNEDLRIDIYHSGGAGGQNVNKVATAVRITHIPTGIVTVCQDERSQLRNKNKAMAVLRARLLDVEKTKQEEEMGQERRSQLGTGDRSEKIRTYNIPQDRVTDHRIGLSLHNIEGILEGDLDELIDALATDDSARMLQEQLA
ncbi:MAG: peptide chain release factor 1 [Chloroflexi bacterium RBG_13_46_14]|nr:MAG: peptide chain release factor 1 [Chloroflexi bacterium RBG_13_46_14]